MVSKVSAGTAAMVAAAASMIPKMTPTRVEAKKRVAEQRKRNKPPKGIRPFDTYRGFERNRAFGRPGTGNKKPRGYAKGVTHSQHLDF